MQLLDRHLLLSASAGPGHAGLVHAADATREAMQHGAPVIYQATFLKDGWRGHADFLERVEHASDLGDWSYEVADTKLARSLKPYFVVQLCLYSELVSHIQGEMPGEMHVILGTGERKSLALADFAAYYRRMREHFVATLDGGLDHTYPEPVPHCKLCRWSDVCDARHIEDDHLSLVARLSRQQGTRLRAEGIARVEQLATAGPEDRPSAIGDETFERIRQQARLQVDQRASSVPSYELLEPSLDPDGPRRGLALLPQPSEAMCSSTSRATRSTRTVSSTCGASPTSRTASGDSAPSGAATAPQRAPPSRRSSTSSSSAGGATPTCTSTTTPPTRRPR